MRRHLLSRATKAAIVLALLAVPVIAQPPGTISKESDVRPYTLPDPLKFADGSPVHDAAGWRTRRRPELLRVFEQEVYGRTPGPTPRVVADAPRIERRALGGVAVRKQVTLQVANGGRTAAINVLMYLPSNAPGRVPVFVGLNFQGNQAVHQDPGIELPTAWMPARNAGVIDHRATEASRGTEASRWPVELILRRGYGLVTAYYGDLDPDFDDGFQNGVQPLFYKAGQSRPANDEWGAVGAWAWGLSRILDHLETDVSVDGARVAVIGHSRLGKAALWAGAQDPRFALVVSNDSGCGGAALSKRVFGETVAHITSAFPHWFAGNFRKYAGREADLPVDQHELLALIAPRPLYVASAAEDLWADPRGEFLGARGAHPVYTLLGQEGLGVSDMPAIDHPVGRTIGYHVRAGGHDVKTYDWEQYLAFADRHLRAGVSKPVR